MMDQTLLNNKLIAYLQPYHPAVIGIFGSYARNEPHEGSDLDVLIHLHRDISLLDLVRMERELSELLNVKVDLVTERSIRNAKLKNYIEKDLQIIFHE